MRLIALVVCLVAGVVNSGSAPMLATTEIKYDSGDYTETLSTATGTNRELQGNYVIVFRKQKDGKWLIVQHVWTDKRGK